MCRLSDWRAGIAALLALAVVAGCHPQDDRTASQLTGGDPRRGRAAIAWYGCGGCHTIPGVDASSGLVGPSLQMIGDRTYIAGNLPNHSENLILWITDPQKVEPGTAMPDLNVSQRDARDIAAYLYTLRRDRS